MREVIIIVNEGVTVTTIPKQDGHYRYEQKDRGIAPEIFIIRD